MDESGNRTTTFRDRFWKTLCANMGVLVMINVICTTLLVLSLMIYPFSEPNTPSYVLLQIDILLLIVFVTVLFGIIYRCYSVHA